MQWFCKKFDELTIDEFHQILKLRIDVFVVEQNCPYYELDGKDKKTLHVFAVAEEHPDRIIAYTRIFKPNDYYKEAAFGRVVVHQDFRKQKLGYTLIEKTLEAIQQEFNTAIVKISAQTYLKKFYESFDFKQVSEEYLEDDIPHIDMLKQ